MSYFSPNSFFAVDLGDILEGNYYRSIEVRAIWDQVWDSFFNLTNGQLISGKVLYSSICSIGIVMCILSLLFISYELVPTLQRKDIVGYLVTCLSPLIILIMLSNNGRMIAEISYNLRNLINFFNEQILSNTFAYVNLNESFKTLQSAMVFDSVMSENIKQCDVLMGTEQTSCLLTVAENLKIQASSIASKTDLDKGKQYFDQISEAIMAGTTLGGESFLSTIRGLLPSVDSIIFSIPSAMMTAFQHSLEIGLLGSAWVAPIALGASAFPGRIKEKPIIMWLIAFLSVGMAKIYFNLIVGFAAHVAIQAISIDIGFFKLPIHLFVCLFAPLLASALASGGGIAVYRGVNSGLSSLASTAGQLSTIFL